MTTADTKDPRGSHINEWLETPHVQSRIDAALHGADDGELYLEQSQNENYEYADRKLKVASVSSTQGFGLRAVKNELVGFAHSNRIDDAALDRAIGSIELVRGGASGRWDASPPGTNQQLYSDANPNDGIPVAEKIEILSRIDAYAHAKDPRVHQVNISLSGNQSAIDILRPGGERFRDIRPLVNLRVTVMVMQNGRVETGTSGGGGRHDMQQLLADDAWKRHVDEAIRIACVNLEAEPAPAGAMSVVLEAGWSGVMVHEAVGHGLEGDAIFKNQSIYAGRVGEQVAAKGVTIVDNGAIAHRRGSLTIDDEGTPTQENVLIEDGILKGFMHDRLSARLMGVTPTGNGRRQSYAHEVMPRMTNTYMTAGEHEREEILASVDDGIFAVSLGGGQVNPTSGDFVFKCEEAYRIRKGKVEEPVKGATIIGNGPKAMQNVTMVGNHSELDPGIGSCGKYGQTIPVCVGQPMVAMKDITVGGTA